MPARKPRLYSADTIGGLKEHRVLIEILDEHNNPHMSKRVMRVLEQFNSLINRLTVLDPETFNKVSQLVLSERRQSVMASNYPENVKTFILNCMYLKRKFTLKEMTDEHSS